MRHGEITPTTAAQTVPVVYVDVPWATAINLEVSTEGYPGLMTRIISDAVDADGNVIVRVEGPLPQLMGWARVRLASDFDDVVAEVTSRMYLAR